MHSKFGSAVALDTCMGSNLVSISRDAVKASTVTDYGVIPAEGTLIYHGPPCQRLHVPFVIFMYGGWLDIYPMNVFDT